MNVTIILLIAALVLDGAILALALGWLMSRNMKKKPQ